MAMSVPEAAAHCLGWAYAIKSTDNRFPAPQEPLPARLLWRPGDRKLIDCSSYLAMIAAYVHADLVDWDPEAYPDMQIMDAARLWSPVDCWERHGLGTRIPTEANRHGYATVVQPAQGWAFYQAWVDIEPAEVDGDPIGPGHQFAAHGGMGIRIHSSSRGGRGPVREALDWAKLLDYYAHGIQGVALSATLTTKES